MSQTRTKLKIETVGPEIVLTLAEPIENVGERSATDELFVCYCQYILHDTLPIPHIFTAERIGISLFHRELDFTKNQVVDLLQKLNDSESQLDPRLPIDQATSRYAMPIRDNINYTRSLFNVRNDKSNFDDLDIHRDLVDMMNGRYSSRGNELRFFSKKRGRGKSFNIPIHLASTSARGLSDLYFYLRHVAKKGEILIVEEPESHLDATNQRALARLLAKLVGHRLKVLITTHSDYLIKELNNLIMLSNLISHEPEILTQFKYSEDEALSSKDVRAYISQGNTLKSCSIDEYGIDMPVFDEAINDINRTANSLAAKVRTTNCD